MKLKAATDTFIELALWYVLLIVGMASAFAFFEAINIGDSLYWAATTATSTGYGDISPKTFGGKIIAVLLMHISIFFIAPMIVVRLIERLNEDQHQFTHEEQEEILAFVREAKKNDNR